MPLVSIIVPCWGVEKYLDQCVESLVNQTLKDIEIILVDDESPDKVPQMCDSWALKDSRIKVVHKQNGGLGMACNSGLDVAIGEYVAFCDSDDWVDLKMYASLLDAVKSTNSDAVYTSFKYVDLSGAPLKIKSITYSNKTFRGMDEIKEIMKGMISSSPSCNSERQYQVSAKVAIYKRSIITNNNLRFPSERVIPSEDLIFNLDFLSYSDVVITLEEKFYNYRSNPNSITHSVKKDAFKISKALYRHLEKKVLDLNLDEDGLHRVNRMLIATSRAFINRVLKSDLSKADKISIINELCEDPIWHEVRQKYPINKMPIKHRIFYEAMVRNHYLSMKILSQLM